MFAAASPTFAPTGTAFTFDARRPASRGPASFPMTTSATDTYAVGGVSLVTGFDAAFVVDAEATPDAPPASGALGLDAWPSPARDVLTVRTATGGDAATLALVDVLGRVVATQAVDAALDATEHRIDVSALAPGVYALRLTTPGGTRTRAVVVGR